MKRPADLNSAKIGGFASSFHGPLLGGPPLGRGSDRHFGLRRIQTSGQANQYDKRKYRGWG